MGRCRAEETRVRQNGRSEREPDRNDQQVEKGEGDQPGQVRRFGVPDERATIEDQL